MRRAICLILLAASPCIAAERQILSKVYTIDRKYRSMEGPSSLQKIVLGSSATPELLWITGIRTEMVAEDGTTPQLPELMCHVNVDLDSNAHQALFNLPRPTAARLMTLSQGMLSAKLPVGYGFPIASNEPLLLFTQVLNHNIEHPNNLKVRHRVTFDYVRDADLTRPMKPLFNLGASGMVQLNDALALTSMGGSSTAEHNGASCLIGQRAPQAAATSADYTDFYRSVAIAFDEPALTIHFRAEGRQDYTALLFIPSSRPFDLFDPDRTGRTKLYVKRVFITDDAEILPRYLRFVRGVVDSADLPLNVSREKIQESPLLAAIKKGVTSRIFAELERVADKEPQTYAKIWDVFGAVFKEGAGEDAANASRIAPLLRFASTRSDGEEQNERCTVHGEF